MDTTTTLKLKPVNSKGMTLIVIATGQPVRYQQVIETQDLGRCAVLGGSAPLYDGAAGRVQLRLSNSVKCEKATNAVGLAWRVE